MKRAATNRPAIRPAAVRPGAFMLVFAVTLVALSAGCTSQQVERAVYAGGKIAYDTLKASNQQRR